MLRDIEQLCSELRNLNNCVEIEISVQDYYCVGNFNLGLYLDEETDKNKIKVLLVFDEHNDKTVSYIKVSLQNQPQCRTTNFNAPLGKELIKDLVCALKEVKDPMVSEVELKLAYDEHNGGNSFAVNDYDPGLLWSGEDNFTEIDVTSYSAGKTIIVTENLTIHNLSLIHI